MAASRETRSIGREDLAAVVSGLDIMGGHIVIRTEEEAKLRAEELTDTGHLLQASGFIIPEMRGLVSLHEVWGEVADLLEAEAEAQ